ncbi:hypothetical protein CC86DRAFT_407687 [Ophiobolus disseminans]|uniref:Uncharacterized protein n=1 Tax=Ophiobolus disseminans TaxID=1469910 RepID=A0A6A6ZXR3_9PLEO|nr:hypothetical protein CC86DRAFT_407687 [Ophiobolus disseminans]
MAQHAEELVITLLDWELDRRVVSITIDQADDDFEAQQEYIKETWASNTSERSQEVMDRSTDEDLGEEINEAWTRLGRWLTLHEPIETAQERHRIPQQVWDGAQDRARDESRSVNEQLLYERIVANMEEVTEGEANAILTRLGDYQAESNASAVERTFKHHYMQSLYDPILQAAMRAYLDKMDKEGNTALPKQNILDTILNPKRLCALLQNYLAGPSGTLTEKEKTMMDLYITHDSDITRPLITYAVDHHLDSCAPGQERVMWSHIKRWIHAQVALHYTNHVLPGLVEDVRGTTDALIEIFDVRHMHEEVRTWVEQQTVYHAGRGDKSHKAWVRMLKGMVRYMDDALGEEKDAIISELQKQTDYKAKIGWMKKYMETLEWSAIFPVLTTAIEEELHKSGDDNDELAAWTSLAHFVEASEAAVPWKPRLDIKHRFWTIDVPTFPGSSANTLPQLFKEAYKSNVWFRTGLTTYVQRKIESSTGPSEQEMWESTPSSFLRPNKPRHPGNL